MMRIAFVLALVVSSVLLPLQPAVAAVSLDLELLLGAAQLDTHDIVLMSATHIVVNLPGGPQPPRQNAVLFVNGDKITCATVNITECPTPTVAVLTDCSDELTYTIEPGGPGVGTFTSDSVSGTVFNGLIRLTCRTLPPPPTAR